MSSGLSLAQAAAKASVSEERLAEWESGAEQPTVKQLRTLGDVYKRPLAVFYLAEPPKEFQVSQIRDFRKISGTPLAEFSTTLRFEIRRALHRREVAIDLAANLDEAPPSFALSARLDEDAEQVGLRVREFLSITLQRQAQWSAAGYDAFNEVRDKLERAGVLVFQAPVPVEEMRGLAIYLEPFPLVLVSSKEEFMAPRLFTLLHELAHLMLHVSVISSGEEESLRGEAQRVEVYANHVAGAALVPMDDLLSQPDVRSLKPSTPVAAHIIGGLAKRYRVSKETLLRRLLLAERVSETTYRLYAQEWRASFATRPKKQPSPVPPHVTELSRLGRLFPRLVLANYAQEKISGPELSEFLNLKLKHLPLVESELRSKPGGIVT